MNSYYLNNNVRWSRHVGPGIIVIMLMLVDVAHAQLRTTLTLDAGQPGAPIQPTMWGIFFEDINYAADGGLYAELVKNRSFEFDQPLMGWTEHNTAPFSNNKNSGTVQIMNRGDYANERYARIVVNGKNYGISNEGYFGMGIESGKQYNISVLARLLTEEPIEVRFEIASAGGKTLGKSRVRPTDHTWKEYTATLTATGTDGKARLNIWFDGAGVVDLDMISLFPRDTWKQRPNGLRADLVQLLADLQPGFLRFPGGCIVEGRELETRYQWKKTVGNVADRDVIINRWNTEFKHRPAPDYFQSFGLGFFEYFQLAEDLGAAPLPILSCGIACQFNTAELVPMEELDPYIADALDLIEFANGDVRSPWGSLRASMGHPEPFNLKFIGIGNEQWGPQYIERYKEFARAIKGKYPAITLVSGSGPFPDGELFDYASAELRELDAEIVDEHYYRDPAWFLQHATRYDDYDRNGPKIFAGEYAAQSKAIASPENKNNWECALAEAAFMTGLERNADVVYLSSYAPLFAHTEGWQWTPDLIWFDNLKAYGTPNYYVQKLFATNRGTHVLALRSGGKALTGDEGVYGSAVWDANKQEIILKLVNASDKDQETAIQVKGRRVNKGSLQLLKGYSLTDENSLSEPLHVSPQSGKVATTNRQASCTLPARSFTVITLSTR